MSHFGNLNLLGPYIKIGQHPRDELTLLWMVNPLYGPICPKITADPMCVAIQNISM